MRFSYANNNPLSYNDPSGNHPLLIIGAILLKGALISAGVNLATQVIQNGFNNVNWGSIGISAFAGAIGAGWGFVIGSAFAGAAGYGSGLLQAGAHALSGGLQSVMFGGNFGQGAISGIVGSVAGGIGISTGLSQSLVGAFVIGGTPAAITATIFGGDPLQAFITGGTMAAFNHFLHNGPIKKLAPNPESDDYVINTNPEPGSRGIQQDLTLESMVIPLWKGAGLAKNWLFGKFAAKAEKVSGSYLLEFKSGKFYAGKGLGPRMMKSIRRIETNFGDKLINKTFYPASSVNEAFINEHILMMRYGGPKSFDILSPTYNKIFSPGKKLGGF